MLASQLFDSFLVHLGCVDDPRSRESPHRIEVQVNRCLVLVNRCLAPIDLEPVA